jgi:hypothetical protein
MAVLLLHAVLELTFVAISSKTPPSDLDALMAFQPHTKNLSAFTEATNQRRDTASREKSMHQSDSVQQPLQPQPSDRSSRSSDSGDVHRLKVNKSNDCIRPSLLSLYENSQK